MVSEHNAVTNCTSRVRVWLGVPVRVWLGILGEVCDRVYRLQYVTRCTSTSRSVTEHTSCGVTGCDNQSVYQFECDWSYQWVCWSWKPVNSGLRRHQASVVTSLETPVAWVAASGLEAACCLHCTTQQLHVLVRLVRNKLQLVTVDMTLIDKQNMKTS